ncbi:MULTISPECIES: beta-N-acetylhexosaminidase [Flavobacteriaceae]|nr:MULTISPECIES: family 20 glycosylhydrolase [Flavobacteriaceae]
MKNLTLLFLAFYSIIGISQSKDMNLMPWPQEITLGNSIVEVKPNFTIVVNQEITERIEVATTKFLRRLSGRTGIFLENGFAFKHSEIKNPSLEITYKRVGNLEINEDESYQLNIFPTKITIEATTDIGVIYALETLLQLVDNNETTYFFPEVIIKDFPRFTWRGLMIDVARHFHPVDVIKRNLDAMASVKMNVLHWHLTDDQGFRVESKTHPKLHLLGSDGFFYTQEQIKDVVKYAGDRGIRVVPEIDVPGHATAILTAYPEIGSKDTIYSIERFSGIFDPTLDPTNEKTYAFLADLFEEIAALFPDKYFHIGGDENEGKHWDENNHIQDFKRKHNLKTNHDLQTFMNIRLDTILSKLGKNLMGWEEIMTDEMPTTALIHSWKGVNEGVKPGSSLATAAKNGYNTILSNGYYVDLMQPASEHYIVDPMPKNNTLTSEERKRVLGGEATMWSELATSETLDSRLWPRTAAIAERFWSSEEIKDISSMYNRLETISFRLEELGINHIKNKAVILRNITNNQSIEALEVLTKIYEPLKIYTRNKGGTEYKTYSPFTLFADACTADASDAIVFNNLVSDYIETENSAAKNKILVFLNKWAKNQEQFSKIKVKNPILKSIEPLSKNITRISKDLIKIIETKETSKASQQSIKSQLIELEKPLVDVELAILKSLEKLSSFIFE